MNEKIIYTDDLSVGYEKKIVVGGINLSVKRGEILTLIGPNGAGKSTVLKSITGALKAVSGKVFVSNADSENLSAKELSKMMSVLMTDRVKAELTTCREIVESGRFPYTGQLDILSENDKEKINEAINLTNVSDIEDRYFDLVSDGQKQRVMLARALCQEPDIMVLDEPTSFLDIKHKLEMLNILKKLVREKNIAVIMSLHELDMAERISDKVISVKSGKICGYGTPDEIFSGSSISSLYELDNESYEESYCTAELAKPAGEPKIFVIAGGGGGIKIFRALQRKNIPFITGIIHENDIDFPAAKALSGEVIIEKAFEKISEENIKKATEKIDSCRNVICSVNYFGAMNEGNKFLRDYAEKKGFLTKIQY